jgi:hypothetical protein
LYLKISLKISRHQFSIWWSQISVYWLRYRIASKINLRPSNKIIPLNRQLMLRNFQIQYSYLHSNVIMCLATLLITAYVILSIIHIYIHDYIRMEITVLYLKISRHQFSIRWSQISIYWLCYRDTVKITPLIQQLMQLKVSNTIQLSPF